MRTEIYLKPYGEDQEYQRVDLFDDMPIPVTFSIKDIREPDKRQSHYTHECKLPGTNANNRVLNHLFEISINSTFNVNKKADCYVLQDSIEVLRGVFQLRKIINKEGEVVYDGAIFAGIEDLFTAMGDALLTDLDMSDLDHSYTIQNIEDSWSADVGEGYVYPLIDYRNGNTDSADALQLKNFPLRPAVYAKEYLDRIFTYAGKTYTSSFLSSVDSIFKNLIIPFNKKQWRYSDAEIIAREFRAELSSNFEHQYTGTSGGGTTAIVAFDNDSTGTAYDPSDIYDNTIYKWTVPNGQNGWYSAEFFANIVIRMQDAGTPIGNFEALFEIVHVPIISGVNVLIASQSINIANTQTTTGANQVTAAAPVLLKSQPRYYEESDIIYIRVTEVSVFGINVTNDPCFIRVSSTGAYFKNIFQNAMAETMLVTMDSAVPEKIQMRDFLLGLCKMFNLYIEEDKDNSNNYLIETRDDYYTDDFVDWTDKLDISRELEITPMSEIQGRLYRFRYKEDKDFWNEYYQNKYKIDGKPQTYGERDLEIDNDWVTEEIVTEPIFSATPMVGSEYHTRVIPVIIGSSSEEEGEKEADSNIRILYYAGLLSYSGQPWAITYTQPGAPTTASYDTYPYAGHLDDPIAPTLDLSFSEPREVQWQIQRLSYTDANLYNVYHKRAMEEVTNVDSRLVTGWFRLTPKDIGELSFRKKYYFANDVFRLNKIIEYDVTSEGLTRCEFIRLTEVGAFTGTTGIVYGGEDDDDLRPRDGKPQEPRGGIIYGGEGEDNLIPGNVSGYTVVGGGNIGGYGIKNLSVLGNDNFIGANGVTISIAGDNNTIGISCSGIATYGQSNTVERNCENISIFGNANTISAECDNVRLIGSNNCTVQTGLENIVLINCDALAISASDATWIDGCEHTCPP